MFTACPPLLALYFVFFSPRCLSTLHTESIRDSLTCSSFDARGPFVLITAKSMDAAAVQATEKNQRFD